LESGRVLSFHHKSKEIMEEPGYSPKHPKDELLRLLDGLVNAGYAGLVHTHLIAWSDYYIGKTPPGQKQKRTPANQYNSEPA
jgi:hypothetical protein